MRLLAKSTILLLALLSSSLYGEDNSPGVTLERDAEKNVFLFPIDSSPHQAKSSANAKDLGITLAQIRFVTTSKVHQKSTFNKHQQSRAVYQKSLSRLPALLCQNTSYGIGKIYYRLYMEGSWSEEHSQTVGGHLVTSIPLDDKTEKIQVTRIQFK